MWNMSNSNISAVVKLSSETYSLFYTHSVYNVTVSISAFHFISADDICDVPVDITWQYHVTGSVLLVVRPSLSQVRRSGIHYRTVSVTRRSAVIVSDNCWRRTYFGVTMSIHSAVEMLHDSALYKFMIDIDIDIDINGINFHFHTFASREFPPIIVSYGGRSHNNMHAISSDNSGLLQCSCRTLLYIHG